MFLSTKSEWERCNVPNPSLIISFTAWCMHEYSTFQYTFSKFHLKYSFGCDKSYKQNCLNLMFIGPCIIVIVDEWKTNLMSLAILFHLLCAQKVSDINISIFRSLRLCWWITTSVVLFSVRCVLELLLRLVFGGVRFAGWSLQQVTSSWSFIRQKLSEFKVQVFSGNFATSWCSVYLFHH